MPATQQIIVRTAVRVLCAVIDAVSAQLLETSYSARGTPYSERLEVAYRSIKACKNALVDYLEGTE